MTSTAHARMLLRKLGNLRRQPAFVVLWLAPTWVLLGLSRGCIALVPFRRLASLLGTNIGPAPWVPLVNARQAERARLIARTVAMAARYTPWESNCFPQAVTARLLLGLHRIPFALYFGLRRPGSAGALQAHAWVVAGSAQVAGGAADFDHYTVVGCFVAPRVARRLRAPGEQRDDHLTVE
jgi:hypothetical protein